MVQCQALSVEAWIQTDPLPPGGAVRLKV